MLTSHSIRDLKIKSIHERLLEKSAPSEPNEIMTFATAFKIALSLENSQNSSKEISQVNKTTANANKVSASAQFERSSS